MYKALIVDDELPALRFVSSLIEKYAPQFEVSGTCASGELAAEFLSRNTVDLLITDISMHGMSGIELSRYARSIQPNIHILIISGYNDFEYAQGAVQVGADDYILKPISISKMSSTLAGIADKLDSRKLTHAASVLPAIACKQPITNASVAQIYVGKAYYFALVRWGNLNVPLHNVLQATSLLPSPSKHFFVLRGRDDDEQILIYPAGSPESFLAELSVYMTERGQIPTWTAVYTPGTHPIDWLPNFIDLALSVLYNKTVIGRHQIFQLTSNHKILEERLKLPASDLKQFGYFVSSGRCKIIKDYFLTLAAEWERQQIPQRQVFHLVRQLLHQFGATRQIGYIALENFLHEFDDILLYTPSYAELMSSVYSMLFDSDNMHIKKMSTQELYDYAVRYIEENYAQPLNMQSVCEEVGISQTYMSRLFRKYGNNTFNSFLTQCRMEAAKTLLTQKPKLLLRDIAACVGYEDSSYFTKVFHQYTGKTPSQFTSDE